MNEVNNRDKVFATKGHDNLRGQDKNNKSKNAILLLLLIDGILVAYLFTLLDSDQDQPVSDDILVMVLLDFETDQTIDIDSTLFTHNLVA
ncbi:MAG: hypothetical protein EBZ18_00135 [Alphaproteobacteria bacterium]|nr:hypothetical protein [Alphaproteobacteria bacterium]